MPFQTAAVVYHSLQSYQNCISQILSGTGKFCEVLEGPTTNTDSGAIEYVPYGFNYKCIPVFIFAERSRVDDEYDMQTTSQLF